MLSHGYTETAEKHLESIYYFLRGGYHVFMPEHCGHGHSYRLCRDTKDLSLVHVDDYKRYVDDLLFVARTAAKDYPNLPLLLYGHSMGGGIAAAAAAQAPELFSRLILSSPMIRPSSAPIPWPLARLIARTFCILGKSEQYVAGHRPYDGQETFVDSASISEARFDYYQQKRNTEPLYQMSAASYGWLWQTARLNRYLQKTAWRQIARAIRKMPRSFDTRVLYFVFADNSRILLPRRRRCRQRFPVRHRDGVPPHTAPTFPGYKKFRQSDVPGARAQERCWWNQTLYACFFNSIISR